MQIKTCVLRRLQTDKPSSFTRQLYEWEWAMNENESFFRVNRLWSKIISLCARHKKWSIMFLSSLWCFPFSSTNWRTCQARLPFIYGSERLNQRQVYFFTTTLSLCLHKQWPYMLVLRVTIDVSVTWILLITTIVVFNLCNWPIENITSIFGKMSRAFLSTLEVVCRSSKTQTQVFEIFNE